MMGMAWNKKAKEKTEEAVDAEIVESRDAMDLNDLVADLRDRVATLEIQGNLEPAAPGITSVPLDAPYNPPPTQREIREFGLRHLARDLLIERVRGDKGKAYGDAVRDAVETAFKFHDMLDAWMESDGNPDSADVEGAEV